jgi:hypothetical protein
MDEIEGKPSKQNKIYPISTIVELLRSGHLDLEPDYQRGDVWKPKQRSALIDTVLNDLDVPKLYWFEKGPGKFEVVDGKQRITTFRMFLDNELELDGGEYDGLFFRDLPVDIKSRVLEFKVVVMQLSGDRWDEDVVQDMFLRLQNGTPLNPAEKRRAIMGKIGPIVDDMAATKVMAENCAIPESRYGREDAAAKIIHLALGNPDIKAKAIEETYKKGDLNENHEKIKAAKRALNILSRGFNGRGVFFKKYSIISATTAIIELLAEYSFSEKETCVADALQSVEAKRKANDKDPSSTEEGQELTKLTAAARSDRADHIKFRRDFYRKVIISAGITPVDQRRAFSVEEKAAIYFRDGRRCKCCSKEFPIDQLEVDHIKPFSRGGLTELPNAQLLCVSCNRSKGATV